MNSFVTSTALERDYALFADALLHHAQRTLREDSPLTIAILAKDYLAHLPHLYALWQRQQRPWHVIVLDQAYKTTEQQLKTYAGFLFDKLRAQYIPLPGLHRVDIHDYQFSINMLLTSNSQDWKQFSAHVHWFICDDIVYPEALRMSEPNACVVGFLAAQDSIKKVLHASQFQVSLERQSNVRGLWYLQHARSATTFPAQRGRDITVVGAGVAGAGVAFALAERGWNVKVLDPLFATSITTSDAYHYASGAVTPVITADDCHKARLSRAGVLRAKARWQAIFDKVGINACGTLELNREKGYAKNLLDTVQHLSFPEAWVSLVEPKEASALAGMSIEQPGVFFPFAMQIPPVRLAYTLLQHQRIECVPMYVHRIIHQQDGQFTLCGRMVQADEQYDIYALQERAEITQESVTSPFVVIATAMNSLSLLQQSNLDKRVLKSGQSISALGRLESLHALAGEVMMIPDAYMNGGPKCIVAGQGYYLPSQAGFCVMGSSYVHGELYPTVSATGQQAIWQKIPIQLPSTLSTLQTSGALKGRACVRAVVQGRLPVIAELPHAAGLWITAAYASHGMTWSSLAGDIIGASLEGEPLPVEKDLLTAISLRA